MPKLPAIKPKELIRKLEKMGFVFQRSSGSHMIFRDTGGNRAVVPYHLRKEDFVG